MKSGMRHRQCLNGILTSVTKESLHTAATSWAHIHAYEKFAKCFQKIGAYTSCLQGHSVSNERKKGFGL